MRKGDLVVLEVEVFRVIADISKVEGWCSMVGGTDRRECMILGASIGLLATSVTVANCYSQVL